MEWLIWGGGVVGFVLMRVKQTRHVTSIVLILASAAFTFKSRVFFTSGIGDNINLKKKDRFTDESISIL